jgi:uncharacterized integral membrane protein (TIGR00698 family)
MRARPGSILFVIAALLAAAGLVTPPLALAAGLLLALTLGNPFPGGSARWSRRLLQASVIGLGFGLDLPAVWQAGRLGFGFTVATIFGTLAVGWLVGRMLRVEREASLLISTGTAICGGSAIAAVGAVLDADARAMSVALGTVFVLNAVTLFVFPPLGLALGLTQQEFGLWSAIAIHDTSSVVGAAARYGDEALALATTVKLSRALWIVPLAMGLALRRGGGVGRVRIPWFILLFLAAAALRTLWPAGEAAYSVAREAAVRGLTLTLFLIGAGMTRNDLRESGLRPLVQGVVLWAAISVGGFLAVVAVLR